MIQPDGTVEAAAAVDVRAALARDAWTAQAGRLCYPETIFQTRSKQRHDQRCRRTLPLGGVTRVGVRCISSEMIGVRTVVQKGRLHEN